MKTLYIFFLIFVAANAYSIDALKRLLKEELEREKAVGAEPKRVTLREYLDRREYHDPQEHEHQTGLLQPKRRVELCADCLKPQFPDENSSCESGRWKPDYVKQGEGCECFAGYKCCNDTCQPPTATVESCWEGQNKGIRYGILEKDCCDCDVVRCLPCNTTRPEDEMCPRGGGARPRDCYRYEKHQTYANDERKCWLSGCQELSSDAKNKTCLKECQTEVEVLTYCQFPEMDCDNTRILRDCPNRVVATATAELTKPTQCYGDPVQGDDDASGHYYDFDTEMCKKCQKWTYTEKSCALQNEFAQNVNCHGYGEHGMDKKCFQKEVLKDDCDCDVAECTYDDSKPEANEFDPEDECPRDHRKVSGVTICMKKRDVCKKCPPYIPIADCPNGKVVAEMDCNGCRVSACNRARVPSEDCACKRYKLDTEANLLECDCDEWTQEQMELAPALSSN